MLLLILGLIFILSSRNTSHKGIRVKLDKYSYSLIFVLSIGLYLVSFMVSTARFLVPVVFIVYILLTVYVLCRKCFSSIIESIGATLSILIIISTLILRINHPEIISYVTSPVIMVAIVSILYMLSITMFRGPDGREVIEYEVKVSELSLIIVIVVVVGVISYLSSLVGVYTPFSDYPRHLRYIQELYYNPLGYEKTPYIGYHSFAVLLLHLAYFKPGIEVLYYLLAPFSIPLVFTIYVLFKRLSNKPMVSLYLWVFASSFSSIIFLFSKLSNGFIGSLSIEDGYFYNYVLFKLVDPEIIGLFIFSALVYLLVSKRYDRISKVESFLYALVLSITYFPQLILYSLIIGVTVNNRRELLRHIMILSISVFLGLTLAYTSFTVPLLIILGLSVSAVLAHILFQLIEIFWNKISVIVFGGKFIVYAIALSIIFIFINKYLYSNLPLYRLSHITLRYVNLFEIPWYLGFYIIPLFYTFTRHSSFNKFEQNIINASLRNMFAVILFILLLDLLDYATLGSFDVFKLVTVFHFIYWAFRLIPYLLLFLAPIVSLGLDSLVNMLKTRGCYLWYTILVFLIVVQVLATVAVSTYSSLQVYSEGKLSNDELSLIKFFTKTYEDNPHRNNICIFAFTNRDRYILQYIPTNNQPLYMFYNFIYSFEDNMSIVTSVLLSMNCSRYYFVLNTLVFKEPKYMPKIMSLVREHYDELKQIGYFKIYVVSRESLEKIPHRIIDINARLNFLLRQLEIRGSIKLITSHGGMNTNCYKLLVSHNSSRTCLLCNGSVKYCPNTTLVVSGKGSMRIRELILKCEPREICDLFSYPLFNTVTFNGTIRFTSLLHGYWIIGKNLVVRGLYEKVFNSIVIGSIALLISYFLLLFLPIMFEWRKLGD